MGDAKHIKEQVEEVFGAKVESCHYSRSFALNVRFVDYTDIYTTDKFLKYDSTENQQSVTQDLLDLQKLAPLIIYENAGLSWSAGDQSLSENKKLGGEIGAHFFHSDFFNDPNTIQSPSTFLYNVNNVNRDAPTYYALVDSVKQATASITSESLPSDKRKLEMGYRNLGTYEYTASERNFQIMHIINATLGHDFTKAVYDHISENDKISVPWQKGANIVVMHSNLSDVVHARPAMGDTENRIASLDLIPET